MTVANAPLPDADDLLGGTSAPSISFKNAVEGTSFTGTVVLKETMQQRDYDDTSKLLTWDDGTPKLQVVVTLATDLRDPEVQDDDGTRRLYAKGNLLTAIKKALREAKSTLDVGGRLTITYIGEAEQPNKRLNPPKLYAAVYESPADALLASELGATPVAAPVKAAGSLTAAQAQIMRDNGIAIPEGTTISG